jgi:hypothetical protein
VALGYFAGNSSQGIAAVAVGHNAGLTTQGNAAVAVGVGAGLTTQGDYAVAVGTNAGASDQGENAVAIGLNAGYSNQGNNSIIINATGSALNQTTADTFTVAPVRNDVANVGQVMFYNTTSKEITYGNTISVAGNISAGNVNITGNIVDTGALSIITGSNGNIALIPNGTGIVTASGAVSAVGNITGGNLITSGLISATTFIGNIQGSTTVSGNLTVTGNLTVLGNTSTISTNNFIVNDNIILMAGNNPANILDIGFAANYTTDALRHTGFVKDAGDGTWKLFSNVPQNITTEVNFTNAIYDPILTGNITAPYFLGNGSQLTGLISTYSNSNVALYMTTYGGPINANIITGTANATINGLTVNTSGVFTTTLRAAGGLQATPIGNAAASTGQFTTVSATGNVTSAALTSNASITAITTINALGGLQNTPIGNVVGQASSGSFTTITANGNLTVSAVSINNSATIGTTLGVTGNATVGNLTTVGQVTTTGNVSAGNVNVTGNIVDTGALTIITGASGSVTLAPNGTTVLIATTTGIVGNVLAATSTTAANNVGYLGMPQNATGTATLTIADAGRHIYVTSASQTITIPANSSVAFPIGTAIAFIAGPSATTVSIAITTDTMYLAGTGTTGTRTLAAYGMATAVKVAATTWYINGSGLT